VHRDQSRLTVSSWPSSPSSAPSSGARESAALIYLHIYVYHVAARARVARPHGDGLNAPPGECARIAQTTASFRTIARARARGTPRARPRATRRISRHHTRGASRPFTRRASRATANAAPRPPVARSSAHRPDRRRRRRAPAPVRAPTRAHARASRVTYL